MTKDYDFTKDWQRIRFYNSGAWRGVNGVRNKVMQRDNYECVHCKEKGLVTTKSMGKLEVDHIIELEKCTYEMAIDMHNLRVLCNFHHNVRHNRFTDSNNYRTTNKWANDERW